MSLITAMNAKLLSLSPDEPVDSALEFMRKNKVDIAPVVDQEERLVGMFSLSVLLKNVLPLSIPMSGGFDLDIKLPAAPGIAKRLNKIHGLKVSDVMERRVNPVSPEMPIWDAVSLLVQQGGPLVVSESSTGKVLGTINFQSAMDELLRLKDAET